MASARSRDWLLDRIYNKIVSRPNSLRLHPQKPFVYFGSYFKGTKVKAVDEFDVLVVIDSSTGMFLEGNTKIADGMGAISPNPQYSSQFYFQGTTCVSTNKNLNWLKSITQEVVSAFGGETPERNGQAITARIRSSDISIDLVPAGLFKDIRTGEEFYIIPKGDTRNGWIKTNPEKDKYITDFYSRDRDDFKNLIRILKFIRDKYNMAVSSFAIECCAAYYADLHCWFYLSKNLIGMLSFFRDCLRIKLIKDTYDTNNNLLEHLTDDISNWYANRVDTIINTIIGTGLVMNENQAYSMLYRILNNL